MVDLAWLSKSLGQLRWGHAMQKFGSLWVCVHGGCGGLGRSFRPGWTEQLLDILIGSGEWREGWGWERPGKVWGSLCSAPRMAVHLHNCHQQPVRHLVLWDESIFDSVQKSLYQKQNRFFFLLLSSTKESAGDLHFPLKPNPEGSLSEVPGGRKTLGIREKNTEGWSSQSGSPDARYEACLRCGFINSSVFNILYTLSQGSRIPQSRY